MTISYRSSYSTFLQSSVLFCQQRLRSMDLVAHEVFRIENMSSEFKKLVFLAAIRKVFYEAKAVNSVWQRISHVQKRVNDFCIRRPRFSGFQRTTSAESISISRPVSRKLYRVTESTKVVDVLIANFYQSDRFSLSIKREKKREKKCNRFVFPRAKASFQDLSNVIRNLKS